MRLWVTNFLLFFFLLFPSSLKTILPSQKIIPFQKFLVTAYYTPEKNQKKYYTGSYSKEIKLNGRGKTCLGKIATFGTIAADLKILKPGTKIFIPGYGVGVVRDCGKKIKGKKLDIWMGKGEKGLNKALNWGKRYVLIYLVF